MTPRIERMRGNRGWFYGRWRLIWLPTFAFYRSDESTHAEPYYVLAFFPWRFSRSRVANPWHPALYVEWRVGPFMLTRFETEEIAYAYGKDRPRSEQSA